MKHIKNKHIVNAQDICICREGEQEWIYQVVGLQIQLRVQILYEAV